MPVVSVGDMAQQFISMRQGGAIKTELAQLGARLSTGRIGDVTAALGGDTARLSGINHSLKTLDGYLLAAQETGQTLGAIQTVLARLDTLRGDTSAQLLQLSSDSLASQIDAAGDAAADVFADMVGTLNTQIGDRALLGGTAVIGAPLAPAGDMLTDLLAAIGAAATATDIITAVETWFDDPAGGFATMGYLGDVGPPRERPISEGQRVSIDARADDLGIREVLKAAAIAAVAAQRTGLGSAIKTDLLQQSGQRLHAAATGLIALQARTGAAEAEIARTGTALQAQKTALEIARNDMIGADPYETASRLQAVQLQLETHYSVTARLSRISLLDYI